MRSLLFPLLFICALGNAQNVVNVDKVDGAPVGKNFYIVGGNPVSTAKYVKVVSSSPYLFDEKLPGKIEMYGGGVADSLLIRVDLVDNSVLYSLETTAEMIATSLISKITLNNPANGQTYVLVDSRLIKVTEQSIASGWYQLLVAGKATLYKKTIKDITEYRPYNSATFEQNITDNQQYFVFLNSKLVQTKKIADLPNSFPDHRPELTEFIKKNKLNGKKDSDYISVINYYNTLPTGN